MKWQQEDYIYMSRALQLAARGLYTAHPNPRVGCVLVKDNRIIGEGWHRRTGDAHAEINAIHEAGNSIDGAACYVTLEPCAHTGRTPPCTESPMNAGIGRVVIAMSDPNPSVSGKGMQQLQKAGIETVSGLLESRAKLLNVGFIHRMQEGLPYIRCKLAVSLDGRTAMADGTSQWITGEAARNDVQKWRAQSGAIVTGIGTVLSDNPQLNVRELDTDGRQPLRVILDRKLRVRRDARIFATEGETLVFTVSPCPDREQSYSDAGMNIKRIDSSGGRDFLQAVFRQLAMDHEINDVLVECGPVLAGSLIQAGLMDELIIYMAPVLLGDAARPLMYLPGLEKMQDKIQMEYKDIRMVGEDVRIILKPKTDSI